MRRTTLMLDDDLYRAVKRKAIDRGRPMRTLVEEALKAYLGLGTNVRVRQPRFGVYPGRVVGSFRRADIYAERLDRKFRRH